MDGLPPGDSLLQRRSHPRLCFSSSEALRDKSSLSLWISLSWWSETGRKWLAWMWSTSSSAGERSQSLTKCWLSAYISRAWSVSCSHTAKVATKAVRRHTGGYAVCQWRRPKIPSRSESTASATGSTPLLDVTGWPCCNSKSQAHPWTHLLGPLLVHSCWSTWVLVVFWQRLWSFGRHLSTHESRSTRILVCQAA